MSCDVYGIGNALVDIQAQVSDEFLTKVRSEHFPGVIKKGTMHLVNTDFQAHLLNLLEGESLHTVSGGSACNTMLGLAQLECSAKYAGKVGDDLYGNFFTKDLHREGVAFDVPMGKHATGTCIILVTPDAQRTMFTNLGISVELTPDDISEADVAAAQWIYIEGYLWDAPGPRAASLKAMQLAKQHGVKVAYTFSDPFCVERARADFRRFTQNFVDLVFCNEDEARTFMEEESLEAILAGITSHQTGVAMTRSEKGSIISWNGIRHEIPPVLVKPVDTTGAGDLYAAGVLAGLSRGNDIATAGRLGSRLASEVIAIPGARLPKSAVHEARVANGE
jgi:sugar/nucleoside kinase (ribokinase family)